MTTIYLADWPFPIPTLLRNLPPAADRSATDSPPVERAVGGDSP